MFTSLNDNKTNSKVETSSKEPKLKPYKEIEKLTFKEKIDNYNQLKDKTTKKYGKYINKIEKVNIQIYLEIRTSITFLSFYSISSLFFNDSVVILSSCYFNLFNFYYISYLL